MNEANSSSFLECRRCVPGHINDPNRLQLLAQSGLLDQDDPYLNRLTALTRDLLNVPIVLVSLVDLDRQYFPGQSGLDEPQLSSRQTPLSHSFCQLVVTGAEPLVVNDSISDTRVSNNPAVKDLKVLAYAGFPIISRKQVLGSYCAIHNEPHQWTELELRLLRQFSESVSDMVESRLDLLELEQTRVALANSNQKLEKFSDILSHDLRAPLRGINGCLDLLQTLLEPLEEEPQEIFDHISASSQRMTQLIEALSRFSKAFGGTTEKSAVNLDQLLQEIKTDLAEDLRGCSGTVLKETDLGEVTGNPPLLRQLWQNLIANGMKFQSENQNPLVSVGRLRDGTFYVQDNGIGLDPKYHEAVFEVFRRIHGKQYEGTGMGLAICARVVQEHGGKIWVESSPGQGARFLFTLAM